MVIQWLRLRPCSQCRTPGLHPWSGNESPHVAAETQHSQILTKGRGEQEGVENPLIINKS